MSESRSDRKIASVVRTSRSRPLCNLLLLSRCVFPVHTCAIAFIISGSAIAESFVIRQRDGQPDTSIEARHLGYGPEGHALELEDGQLLIIPDALLVERKSSPDPTPISHEGMVLQLQEEFGAERLVIEVEKPFVIALIRATTAPADLQSQKQFQSIVKKAGEFFKGRQTTFLQFVKQARVETTPVKYPLVALIFESDRQFDAYTVMVTGQQGLSPENIAAFYSLLSNRLVIRLRECATFDTPLHEAVHQQVYNRGILQRLAPVPAWFNEGIATGFEGDGSRVTSGPRVVSDRYGPLALKATRIGWKDVITEDAAFQGDVLAAEAYGHAWGLHWLLVTKYRSQYNKLVRHYAQKKPLSVDRPDARLSEFEDIMGKSVTELQREFELELPKAMKRRER